MKKRFGFTLAEVLITLGIIGVVAAMTIPTLIANTNSAKFRSQFKKTISTLNQAGLMAQAQYDIDYSTLSTASAACTATASPVDGTDTSICAIFNGTLSGHTLSTTTPYATAPTVTTAPSENAVYLTLADGSLFVFNGKAAACTKAIGGGTVPTVCLGYIDVNGATLPNKEVNCATAPATGEAVASTGTIATTTCVVANDANHMTDIYPVAIHDATVEPFTAAAKYVLTTSK